MTDRLNAGQSRREFVKAAVALGGTSALAACLERDGTPDIPHGPSDLDPLPRRQHAWNDNLGMDDDGNVLPPRHHTLLYLIYRRDGEPTADDRDTVEQALRSIERAYQRGNDGLVFTLGYSPAYFDRFDDSLPASVDLPAPDTLAPFEDPEFDEQDAILHLASDHPQVVLTAEQALFGKRETANDFEMSSSLDDVFERDDRRTGFVGAGLPAENQDVDGIPDSAPVHDDAPLFMGFRSAFKKNQASERRVTIDDGAFAGGTTQHIAKLRLQLEPWYEQDSHHQRVAKMFSPQHADEDRVGDVGEKLETSSGLTDELIDSVEETAREFGTVGHTQKVARARRDDEPLILRRDFDSTDDGHAGLHFLSVQETIEDFVVTQEAMNGSDLAGDTPVSQRTNNGILQYVFVRRRGNFLLPPRPLRALPPANPE